MRKKELRQLTVAHLEVKGPVSYILLNPADENSREGNDIPLRSV